MTLLALFYKAWHISKRQYVQSLLIIIIPLIPFVIMVTQIDKDGNPDARSWDQETIIYNKTTKQNIIEEAYQAYVYAVYCPKNNFTDSLMNNVASKIKTGMFHGLETEDDIQKWFMNNSKQADHALYGIIFNIEMNDTKPPSDFKYTLRDIKSDSLPTNLLFPIYQVPGPNEAGAPYFYKGLLGLKIAIDDAFLNEAGITERNWTLQQFPYPAHKRNEENFLATAAKYVALIVALVYLYGFSSVLSIAVIEKVTGIVERMRMFGMTDFMLLLYYNIHALLKCTVSTLIVAILLKLPIDKGVLANSNIMIIWIVLILFCIHSICFFLAVSSLLNSASVASSLASLLYLLPFAALEVNSGNDLTSFPIAGQVLTSLLPILNLFWAFQNIFGFENVATSRSLTAKGFSQGTAFSDIIKVPPSGYSGLPLILIMLLSILGSALFSFIYYYAINVKPGPFGYAKPWHFIFPRKVFTFLKVSPSNIFKNESEVDVTSKGLYERVPDNVEVGLKIVNLNKTFGNVVPVKDLSLDIYVGQITALLGHNGAGKTTTLSIISGLYSPTSGAVFYRGYNIFSNIKAFRYELGLCPQENMLIDSLSTWEHLMFFGMLKGIPVKELKKSSMSVLQHVGLQDRINVLVSQLSGGMKRKLCLALAFVGSPKVIVLDEPTSGLDPESRREVWNILLKQRENRIMIITTHFMEEADALGDQIAIMDHGEIKCYGTPMFLKKHYGAGYQITVCSNQVSMFNDIIKFVTMKIPSASVLNKTDNSIVFNIHSSCTNVFPDLFESLQSKEEFQIHRIGINCTSMEDVFLKVGEEADKNVEDVNNSGIAPISTPVHLTDLQGRSPINSFWQRFCALIIKNMINVKQRRISNFLTLLFLPFCCAYWTINGTNTVVSSEVFSPPLSFDLKIYGPTEVLMAGYNTPKIRNEFTNLIKGQGSYGVNVETLNKNTIIDGLLEVAAEDVLKFRQSMIVAGDFNDSLPNVLFSSIAIHSPVIAANLLYNTLLKAEGKNYSISTVHHPYTFLSNFCSDQLSMDAVGVVMSWQVLAFLLVGLVGQVFIKAPHIERTTLFKHLQLMTDVSPITYWLSFFIVDLFLYCCSIGLMLIILTSFDTVGMLSSTGAGVVYLIMFLFGFSGIWMAYCFTYLFKTPSSASNLFVTPMFFLALFTLVLFNILPDESKYVITYILRLIPICPFVSAMQKFTTSAVIKLKCSYCPNAYLMPVCTVGLHEDYFDSALNKELYFLGLDWIIYVSIIMLIEYDYFSMIWNKIKSFYIGFVEKSDLITVESDVAKERDRVDAALQSNDNDGAPSLIVDSLGKKYSRTFTAVNDISFATKEGECFGLLGVNGAGKSTTFNILTGIILPTQGNVIVKGHSLSENKRKCLSYIGYCPQLSALARLMTGRQILTLFANLRLAHSGDVETLVNKWISVLGLGEYCDRLCGTYSGGNKRKLSTALAFINNPSIILLDEPTSGVDPVTRRKLWIVLKECQTKRQTVIISSHSMDECEAVCDRLTIMARGYMQCIGNVQHLKSLYGQGFVILIKLKEHSDDEVGELKTKMLSAFNEKAFLKDEHMVLLHYHINDPTFKLSALFAGMEELKEQFEFIDDYSISDSSLEHVFLSFAKKSEET